MVRCAVPTRGPVSPPDAVALTPLLSQGWGVRAGYYPSLFDFSNFFDIVTLRDCARFIRTSVDYVTGILRRSEAVILLVIRQTYHNLSLLLRTIFGGIWRNYRSFVMSYNPPCSRPVLRDCFSQWLQPVIRRCASSDQSGLSCEPSNDRGQKSYVQSVTTSDRDADRDRSPTVVGLPGAASPCSLPARAGGRSLGTAIRQVSKHAWPAHAGTGRWRHGRSAAPIPRIHPFPHNHARKYR